MASPAYSVLRASVMGRQAARLAQRHQEAPSSAADLVNYLCGGTISRERALLLAMLLCEAMEPMRRQSFIEFFARQTGAAEP